MECDFIMRDREVNDSYVQVSYTIIHSKETEDREYKPFEQIKDSYPKFLQKRNGIKHINIIDLMESI